MSIAGSPPGKPAPRQRFPTKVVTLLATVHHSGGSIVTNLNREDFHVEEDGVPQTIKYFSRESDLPLTIGLLVDTSRSQTGVLERERAASHTFLDQVLRGDKDRAFVAHFDIRVEVLQYLTSSRAKLAAALDELKIPPRGSTLLYRAVRECSENQMRKQPGRKAFVILSDSVDVHSETSIVTWPLIAYAPQVAPIRAICGARGKHALRRLARETGGACWAIPPDSADRRAAGPACSNARRIICRMSGAANPPRPPTCPLNRGDVTNQFCPSLSQELTPPRATAANLRISSLPFPYEATGRGGRIRRAANRAQPCQGRGSRSALHTRSRPGGRRHRLAWRKPVLEKASTDGRAARL